MRAQTSDQERRLRKVEEQLEDALAAGGRLHGGCSSSGRQISIVQTGTHRGHTSPICQTKTPDLRGFWKRMKGLEPSTFCMASRRSSQLSYIREAGRL
jgi:hypothetical protein